VSFISASSYLDGDAFCGMREHMRRVCEEVWILDLGGEGRGTRQSENVFAIQTPVAIAVAVRGGTGFQPVGPDSPINIRYGAYLPHWTKGSSIYSVTFRLADSLPRAVVEEWLAERTKIVRAAREMNRPLTEPEEKRLQHLFSEKVDKYMDAGRGACWMRQDRIAGIVADTLRHFDGERYHLAVWCVMPNHVHVVVEPLPGHELADILHSWKSFSANLANRALGRKGEFWQPEYYDHLIRSETDLAHSIEYVFLNPARAGLKNWKWSGGRASEGATGGGTGFQPVGPGQGAPGDSEHGLEGRATSEQAARVHYARVEGTSRQKLKALDAVTDFASLKWEDCPDDWQAPFRPAGKGEYFAWPLLTDVFAWQQSGIKAGRTWVIAPSADALHARWRGLMNANRDKRPKLFKDSPTGRKATDAPTQLPPRPGKLQAIVEVPKNASPPDIVPCAYRSFDRQRVFGDARMLDRPSPGLWAAHGEGQVYLTSLLTKPLAQVQPLPPAP
jgi:REP element-mobilizing transposase RayT